MPLREEVEEVKGGDGVLMGIKELGDLGRGEVGDEGGELRVRSPVGVGEDLVELGDDEGLG